MSGSTAGCEHYHDKSAELVSAAAARAEAGGRAFRIILWNDEARWSTIHELAAMNAARRGAGGTSPEAFVRHLLDAGITRVEELVLITDGQVGVGSVDRVDVLLGGGGGGALSFGRVAAHLIGPRASVNMSVSAPFTRACEAEVTLHDPAAAAPVVELALSREDMAALSGVDAIVDLPSFEAAAPALERAVAAQCVGRATQEDLRARLLAMRGRLAGAIAAAASTSAADPCNEFLASMRAAAATAPSGGGDAAAAAAAESAEPAGDDAAAPALAALGRFYASWVEAAAAGPGPLKAVDALVSMASGALRVAFDAAAISSIKVRGAPLVDPVDIEDVDVAGAGGTSAPFECPITLDDDETPALLLRGNADDDAPLMAGLDAGLTKRVYECPLVALRCPALLAAIGARLDVPISCRALRDAARAGTPLTVSPLTREPLAGAVPLGANRSNAKAADAALAALINGRRRAGNGDLWFAVLRAVVATTPRLAELAPFIDAQMVWRMAHRKAPAGLGAGAAAFTPLLPLGASIWVTLHLAVAVPGLPPASDPLRARAFDAAALGELAALARLPLPRGAGARATATRLLLSMIRAAGRNERGFRTSLQCLTQASVRVPHAELALRSLRAAAPVRVLLDGAPPAAAAAAAAEEAGLRRLWWRVPVPVLLGVGARVSGARASGETPLSAADIAALASTPLPAPRVSWPAYLTGAVPPPAPICGATMRPYMRAGGGEPWEAAAWAALAPGGNDALARPTDDAAAAAAAGRRRELFPICRWFAEFVCKHAAYPSAAELLVFAARRAAARGRDTLPACAPALCADVVRAFSDIGAAAAPAAAADADGDVSMAGPVAADVGSFVPVEDFVSRYHRSTVLAARAAMEAAGAAAPSAVPSTQGPRGGGASGERGRGMKRGRSVAAAARHPRARQAPRR